MVTSWSETPDGPRFDSVTSERRSGDINRTDRLAGCNKCQAMFYDGYRSKRRCAAGGAPVAQGYNFVLPHPSHTCAHCNDGSCQCGYDTPAGLCANHNGDNPAIGCIQEE